MMNFTQMALLLMFLPFITDDVALMEECVPRVLRLQAFNRERSWYLILHWLQDYLCLI